MKTINGNNGNDHANGAGTHAKTMQRPVLKGQWSESAVRVLRGLLRSMPIDDAARFEIDFRLRQKEREFQQATLVANGVRVEALADDGVVVPGQPVKVSVIIANRGVTEVTVKTVKFDGLEGDAACTLTAVVAAASKVSWPRRISSTGSR